ncbi:MAG: DUF5320 domain-containing protein [Candidatus Diapherotrites archaeon]|nr:DUF5320 domain-containing protein [Candidatus Diapherotrites archaeon]
MPRGDGTGPAGRGPRTGRSLGYCAGFNAPGFANPSPGMGLGMGWGRGRGFGRGMRFWGPAPQPVELSKEQQLGILEQEKTALEQELDAIKKLVKELK